MMTRQKSPQVEKNPLDSVTYRFILALGTNIQKMSPTSKFSLQNRQTVTNFRSPI